MKIDKSSWPVLIISGHMEIDNDVSLRIQSLIDELEEVQECSIKIAYTFEDAYEKITAQTDLGTILVDWELPNEDPDEEMTPQDFIEKVRKINKRIPILLMTDRTDAEYIPTSVLRNVNGYLYIISDTKEFLAGRIEMHLKEYVSEIFPEFFGMLVKYTQEYKYAWHTPGHMGGEGFRRSPAGMGFYKFFGENVLRADLSISVPELGSLLSHEGPTGDAERNSAKVFGADYTYYVLNGSSNANQIIWRSQLVKDNLAFVDRNCHKSLNYAMVSTDAYPVYMIPRRNKRGVIGPVRLNEFEKDTIQRKVNENGLIPKDLKDHPIKMSALTNSTYDGICYNVVKIKDKLIDSVENLHFDEAWYAYAKFHPIYKNHFGMTDHKMHKDHPPVLVTQSTHKLLTAFSQSSMLHLKNGGSKKFIPDEFNETYMMHSSTSPQYNMIASLDVATKMMEEAGEAIIHETIVEAIHLRKKIVKIGKELKAVHKNDWFFEMWQPEIVEINGKMEYFENIDIEYLASEQSAWVMDKGNNWHGFDDIEDNYAMLDPIKLTFKTPGLSDGGIMGETGIPAAIVTNYLIGNGIVCEKTDYYSFLLLNSMGITKGKQGTLLSELLKFKELYDSNALMDDIFPEMVEQYPDHYRGVGLKDHCHDIHKYYKEHDIMGKMQKAFEIIPDQKIKPAQAYHEVVRGNVEYIELDKMMDRIPAVMLVPYPPGIPIMMGGEVMNDKANDIFNYLKTRQDFENIYPGYESDIHGVERNERNGKKYFKSLCIKK